MHWLLMAVLLILSSPASAATAIDRAAQPGGPRIRPQDARVARLLQEGLDRSATLRALVDRVEAGNVIVYVKTEVGLAGHLDGGLTWLAASGGFRYVRVSIGPRLQGDAVIATLAHELQHVAEILDAPGVVCSRTLRDHFREIGLARSRDGHAWDTMAAQEAGRFVRRELGRKAA